MQPQPDKQDAIIRFYVHANTPVMIRMLLFFVWMIGTTAQATPTYKMPLYEALHKAGYQCMLTQRIAKCYLSITLNIDTERHNNYLKGSMSVFENNHQRLIRHAPTDEIRHQLEKVEQLWKQYKTIYHETYTKEHAAAVLEFSNQILLACNQTVVLLEHYAFRYENASAACHLSTMINYSEYQCMLSQRAVLYILAIRYHTGVDAINQQRLTRAISSFDTHHQKLLAYPQNTKDIREQLGVIAKNWRQLQQLLVVTAHNDEKRDTEQLLVAALDRSDRLLFASDELAFLYERLKALPEETDLKEH